MVCKRTVVSCLALGGLAALGTAVAAVVTIDLGKVPSPVSAPLPAAEFLSPNLAPSVRALAEPVSEAAFLPAPRARPDKASLAAAKAARVPAPRPKPFMALASETLEPEGVTGALVVELDDLGGVTAEQPTGEPQVIIAQSEAVSHSVRTDQKENVDFGAAVTIANGGAGARPDLVPITVVDQVAPGSAGPVTNISVDIEIPGLP